MKKQAIPLGAEAEAKSALLKALASPQWPMIACRLVGGEETAGALAAFLGVRNSAVSQHLAVMRRERVVSARREEQLVRDALRGPAARDIIKVLSKSICGFEAAQSLRR